MRSCWLWSVLCVGLIGPQEGAIAPIFQLTGFMPDREFPQQRLMLLVGTVRLVAVVLVPMISMSFFIEEKRNRTIEMLFTSPIRDQEITLGKWLGGMVLYSLILAISVVELAVSFRGREHYWWPILQTHFALAVQGGGALAMGEWISAFSRHETQAAALTFLVSMAILQILLHRNTWSIRSCRLRGFDGSWLAPHRAVDSKIEVGFLEACAK